MGDPTLSTLPMSHAILYQYFFFTFLQPCTSSHHQSSARYHSHVYQSRDMPAAFSPDRVPVLPTHRGRAVTQGRRHGFWTGGAACPEKGPLAEGGLL